MLQGADESARIHAPRLEHAYYYLTSRAPQHFALPGVGWSLTGVRGLDAPTMNRAVIADLDVNEVGRVIEVSTDFFDDHECAWSVVLATFRDTSRWHSELLQRGFSMHTSLAVMVRPPRPIEGPPDARIRLADPGEVDVYTQLLMDVFRMPRRFYPALLDMTRAWVADGARMYLGEVDGEPVATTLLTEVDGIAGIYNVGTLRRYRQRGLARGMMARAMADLQDRPIDQVTLQVAPDGVAEPFYRRLGFEPAYAWRFYSPRPRGFFG